MLNQVIFFKTQEIITILLRTLFPRHTSGSVMCHFLVTVFMYSRPLLKIKI